MEKTSSVAALYDVHGNLPALEAVLSDQEDIDHGLIVVGGDVSSGPMPAEVLDRLQAIDDRVRWVRGNADREVVSAYDRGSATEDARSSDPALRASGWFSSRIRDHHRDLMASFEEQMLVDIEGLGAVLFCHATPNNDEEILTMATPDTRLRSILFGVGQNVVVCGHVHTQYDRRLDDRLIVNAGSVGLPYQGEPDGAFWALLGNERVELRCSDYNLKGAVNNFRALGYPGVEDFEEALLQPPDPAWVDDYFERQA